MFIITIKLLHIISITGYFLGIFYIGHLFLCYKYTDRFSTARKKILRRQYLFSIERIWNIIVVPGGLIMLVTGLIMFFVKKYLLTMQWFDLKLIFLSMLSIYHYWCFEKIRHLKVLKGYDLETPSINLQHINEMGILILLLLGCCIILKYLAMIYYGPFITGTIILLFLLVIVLKLLRR
ncbi:CopD family protein [Chryseobacterium sp. CBSDS_008]|uniref:CopD family protein n=1 Tax=Chryseobacterium sp. CBSDS_008 TaxID=3415265 RepID=UPI003CEBB865